MILTNWITKIFSYREERDPYKGLLYYRPAASIQDCKSASASSISSSYAPATTGYLATSTVCKIESSRPFCSLVCNNT